MKIIPSRALIKQSLSGHSWLGLLVGVLMYLICLTGTLVVFYEELERWEQPAAEEYSTFDSGLMELRFNEFMNSDIEVTTHMYAILPTEAMPRASIASENEEWLLNADGSLGEKQHHPWTEMTTGLHVNLTIPNVNLGIIIVSILGALLVGLILSGFIAHPGIFRDAFSFRRQNSKRIEQVDIHNRLSVWGAPFHLMIAITGAYFGLALLVLGLQTMTSDYTQENIIGYIYGEEPVLDQKVETIGVKKALDAMQDISPEAKPMYITLHEAGTPQQFMEIYAKHEDKLIWSENYRFDALGNYIGRAGFLDGEVGRQIIFSVYRLHFGHFGGFMIKVIYAVMGLALTVISVSGINIWLQRRKKTDYINFAWVSFVWGTPLSLVTAALVGLFSSISMTVAFWAGLFVYLVYGLVIKNIQKTKYQFQFSIAVMIFAFLINYSIKYTIAAMSSAALGINISILLIAIIFIVLARRNKPIK